MNPRIVAAFSNVHMGLGHEGLRVIAAKNGFKLEKLSDRELILFINTHRDKLKVLGAKGIVMGYVKMPEGRRLPLEAIQFIPETFGEGKINVDAAIAAYVKDKLSQAGKSKSPLDVARALKLARVS